MINIWGSKLVPAAGASPAQTPPAWSFSGTCPAGEGKSLPISVDWVQAAPREFRRCHRREVTAAGQKVHHHQPAPRCRLRQGWGVPRACWSCASLEQPRRGFLLPGSAQSLLLSHGVMGAATLGRAREAMSEERERCEHLRRGEQERIWFSCFGKPGWSEA